MDRIVRAISSDGLVQAAAICSRDLTERARQIHKLLPIKVSLPMQLKLPVTKTDGF